MAINKVIYGNNTLIDLTGDTVTSGKLLSGETAHNSAGEQIQGTMRAIIPVPTIVESSIYYDGTQKTVEITSYDSDLITVTGTTTATNYGTYNVTFSLNNTNTCVWDDGTTTNKTSSWSIIPKIVTWSSGTIEEISNMLSCHYNGIINIYDYWTVGDSRTVPLSAMTAGSAWNDLTDTHVAQSVQFVLMHKGGKTLQTAINGHTECAFIVGQKDCLKEKGGLVRTGSGVNPGGWNCKRREWCNSTYRNAIPSGLRDIFKQYKNTTGAPGGSTIYESVDYFALPSEKEVIGKNSSSSSTTESSHVQFTYYKTTSNQAKKVDGSYSTWWTRSPYSSGYDDIYVSNSDGTTTNTFRSGGTYEYGISPFGVI